LQASVATLKAQLQNVISQYSCDLLFNFFIQFLNLILMIFLSYVLAILMGFVDHMKTSHALIVLVLVWN